MGSGLQELCGPAAAPVSGALRAQRLRGTQTFWVVFLAYVAIRYGPLKLGRSEDKPEYPTVSWLMMIIAAGLGVGLFTYGVSEAIAHYEPCSGNPLAGVGSTCIGNRFTHLQDDDRAQWAIFLSFLHWGVHGWSAYTVVALLLAVNTHRMCVLLPHTMPCADLVPCDRCAFRQRRPQWFLSVTLACLHMPQAALLLLGGSQTRGTPELHRRRHE